MTPFSVFQCLGAQRGYTGGGQNLEAGSITRSSTLLRALQAQMLMQVSEKKLLFLSQRHTEMHRAENKQLTLINFFPIL